MKKLIIVGAGVSGLSAGVYAARNGFDVTIFEKHIIPGVQVSGTQDFHSASELLKVRIEF